MNICGLRLDGHFVVTFHVEVVTYGSQRVGQDFWSHMLCTAARVDAHVQCAFWVFAGVM